MSGVFGWLGYAGGEARTVLAAMAAQVTWAGVREQASLDGPGHALGVAGPPGSTAAVSLGPIRVVAQGHVRWEDAPDDATSTPDAARRLAKAFLRDGDEALAGLRGDFSLALLDTERSLLLLAVDRMGIRNLVHRRERDATVFAPTLDALAAHPSVVQHVDPQAVYDYVYFHMVPGPGTIFTGSQRLLPGHLLRVDGRGAATRPYWTMRFDEPGSSDPALASRFRAAIERAVTTAATPPACGTFLSGGTDSSTVTGFLAKVRGGTVPSFSIGFDASGYDEMHYARIAARRFATDHHEYYVTPSDVADAIPRIAAEYDQPFGNASAVPTYYCAKLARECGTTRLLAGDGGDELFGGNERYARQALLSTYERVPAPLRSLVLDRLAVSRLAARTPLVRKLASYVRQAREPMPARYESYNLLERLGPQDVFAAGYLATVSRARPLAALQAWWDAVHARTLINRMLGLDLKFTLADNDLPKVVRMCELAGVDVAFPLLDERVVELSSELAPHLKLRGRKLRHFFKESLRGFLPDEIIAKRKHGFGLPAGPWLAGDARLRELSHDALQGLARRGIVERAFVDDLLDRRLREHPGYYGTMVWILMMLELWYARHVDARSGRQT